MRHMLILSIFVTLTWHSGALAQPPIEDEFNSAILDWSIWCPCQINMTEAPIVFRPDSDQPRDRVARITADDVSLGGNICRLEEPDYECRPPKGSPSHKQFYVGEEIDIDPELPEPLGPSLVRPTLITDKLHKNPYCTDEIRRRAKAAGEENLCIQRQELRLQERHRHDVSDPHLYSFRIRMPKQIEDRTNSIRWVTAQWKHKPISRAYCREFDCDVWGPSPFLAQRFDDGVLHVTIQDEHCRCKVASAPFPDGSNPVWEDGIPPYCASTRPGQDGLACTPDLHVEYGENPILSTALGNWVEMRYRVQASRSRSAVIEVYEGERFIVRVTGKIGYKPRRGKSSVAKFKIGQYRDYMPFVHAMEIDWQAVVPATE